MIHDLMTITVDEFLRLRKAEADNKILMEELRSLEYRLSNKCRYEISSSALSFRTEVDLSEVFAYRTAGGYLSEILDSNTTEVSATVADDVSDGECQCTRECLQGYSVECTCGAC